ncbi:hypothetical protein MLD38_028488 [Melastoma candidum]|uniref:Uncharacterized protein n=1 Tax=Melastoma candidum TaxID=119954 RepID=A0ACB9N734_9MYRT|nr:hypothetical protein MLD38_028488 [Melastoma candidum]
MQRSAAHLEAELWKLRERLIETERQRDQALEDLEESQREVDEANAKLSEALTPRKMPEIFTELNSLKRLLANTSRELKVKEKVIEELRDENAKGRDVEARLMEQDATIERLRKELEDARMAKEMIGWDHSRRVRDLEDELEMTKVSESRTADSLAAVTKQLEQTNIALEESKLEIMALRTKHNKDVRTIIQSEENCMARQIPASPGVAWMEEKLARVNDEVMRLNIELRSSIAAEENSKKAMDDLAIALKEVVMESNQWKLKLEVTLAELEHSQEEEANLRTRLKDVEEMYKKLLDESRGENEQLKSIVERLKSEAEELLAAWTEKEASFIECIQAAEDEKMIAQQESIRMGETLKAADRMVKSSREETNKLRDILKQALNEASVAKEAASIARAENSQLKDDLTEKDDALNFLTQENESLRMNEAAATETIRELKKLVTGSSTTTCEEQRKMKQHGQPANGNILGKAFSFNMREIRVHHHHRNLSDKRKSREHSYDGGDPLRCSIFDAGCSPDLLPKHRRKTSWSAFTSDHETEMPEDHERSVVGRSRLDGAESERMSRKKVALLRRFGDLMKRRSYSDRIPAQPPLSTQSKS